MSYDVKTTANLESGDIHQSIRDPLGIVANLVTRTLDTQIRAALIGLGWTPPPDPSGSQLGKPVDIFGLGRLRIEGHVFGEGIFAEQAIRVHLAGVQVHEVIRMEVMGDPGYRVYLIEKICRQLADALVRESVGRALWDTGFFGVSR